MGLQEAGHLGGVHHSGHWLGVGLIRTRDHSVGSEGGGLAIGVGQELSSSTRLGDGEGVSTRSWLSGGLAGVFLGEGLGVSHTVVGDGSGQGDRGGSVGNTSSKSKERELHDLYWEKEKQEPLQGGRLAT